MECAACLPAWDLTTVIIIFSKNTVREKHSLNPPPESDCKRPPIPNLLDRPPPRAGTLNHCNRETYHSGSWPLPSSNQPIFFVFLENLSCSKVRVLGSGGMPPWSRATFVETPAGVSSEIMDEKGARVAYQPQRSILGAFLPRFLLASLYQGSPLLAPPNSQLLEILTWAVSEPLPNSPHPHPRFVSVDPTELSPGSSVVASECNISNLNASLPGLMELIRL